MNHDSFLGYKPLSVAQQFRFPGEIYNDSQYWYMSFLLGSYDFNWCNVPCEPFLDSLLFFLQLSFQNLPTKANDKLAKLGRCC